MMRWTDATAVTPLGHQRFGAHVDVQDVKAEADRLRNEGVEVGVVLELHGELRLLDLFDPDGNRIQFAEDVAGS